MTDLPLPYVAPLLVALATFAATWSLLAGRGRQHPHAIGRMMGQADVFERRRAAGPVQRLLHSLVSPAHVTGRAAPPVRRLLDMAGNPVSLRQFMVLTLGLSAGGALWMLLVARQASLALPLALAMALATTALGAVAPYVWLHGRTQRRRQQIERELPDLLDLLVVSVAAGLTFDAALSRIVEHAHGQLTGEFRRTLAELELGVGRRSALQALTMRTGSAGVSALVAAVLQAERTGMEIGPILRSQTDRLRLQRRQRAAEAAMKAPVKMLFPLIIFIFPSMFVVLLGPAALTLMRTFGQR